MAFKTIEDVKAVSKEQWKTGSGSECWDDLCEFVCNNKNKLVDRAEALRYTHKISIENGDIGVAGGDCESDRRAVWLYMNDGL